MSLTQEERITIVNSCLNDSKNLKLLHILIALQYDIVQRLAPRDRIAQWISAFDFGSKGRGFDSHCGRFWPSRTPFLRDLLSGINWDSFK